METIPPPLTPSIFPAPQPSIRIGTDPAIAVPTRITALQPPIPAPSAATGHSTRLTNLAAFLVAVLFILAITTSGAAAQSDSGGPDADSDGLSDAAEIDRYNTNPTTSDTDGDGLPDGVEISLGTNPNNPDTDGDGVTDAEEYLAGMDPLAAASTPTSVPTRVVPSPQLGSEASGQPSGGSAAVEPFASPGAPIIDGEVEGSTPVTVSPAADDALDSVPETLAFADRSNRRSPLLPIYLLIALGFTGVIVRAIVQLRFDTH